MTRPLICVTRRGRPIRRNVRRRREARGSPARRSATGGRPRDREGQPISVTSARLLGHLCRAGATRRLKLKGPETDDSTEKRGRMGSTTRSGARTSRTPFASSCASSRRGARLRLWPERGRSTRVVAARDYARRSRHHGRVVHAVAPGALTAAALDHRVAPQRGRAPRRPFRSWRRLAGEPLRSAAHTEPTLHARVSPTNEAAAPLRLD